MKNDYVIYDARKLAAYNLGLDLSLSKGFDEQFFSQLWEGLLTNPLLYDEFVYYLQTEELTGHFTCEGYSMFDLYFFHLGEYNFTHDLGKNPIGCDKATITLQAFHTMGQLVKDPQTYKKYLSKNLGMDFGL
ncbi:MAG: hypothetical protein Q4D51_09620 [Eubacteriales bacterium]|nr:hypothetical protein [Eubacteriales bacterium]